MMKKLEIEGLLFVVSKSITELWKAREILYERKPDLRQNFTSGAKARARWQTKRDCQKI